MKGPFYGEIFHSWNLLCVPTFYIPSIQSKALFLSLKMVNLTIGWKGVLVPCFGTNECIIHKVVFNFD